MEVLTPEALVRSTLSATSTALYTTPADVSRTIIKEITITSLNTVPNEFTLYLVPAGATLSDAHILIQRHPIYPDEAIFVEDCSTVMPTDWKLSAKCTNAPTSGKTINVSASGIEIRNVAG